MNKRISKFYVIDFENANTDPSSICQVGLVKYIDGEIIEVLDSLIDPEVSFTPINRSIHGIEQGDVVGAMKFPDLYQLLLEEVKDQLVFNQNGSDESKFLEACEKYKLEAFNIEWLNSATVIRNTFDQFKDKGYGLSNVCEHLGISYNKHNAISDAIATAEVVIKCSDISGKDIGDWKRILEAKKDNYRFATYGPEQKISGNLTDAPDLDKIEEKYNPFYGRKVVISGTYKTWPNRRDLAKLLRSYGADIDTGVSKSTDILCIGENAGPKKIEKMVKRILDGESAQILEEDQIFKLLSMMKK